MRHLGNAAKWGTRRAWCEAEFDIGRQGVVEAGDSLIKEEGRSRAATEVLETIT